MGCVEEAPGKSIVGEVAMLVEQEAMKRAPPAEDRPTMSPRGLIPRAPWRRRQAPQSS